MTRKDKHTIFIILSGIFFTMLAFICAIQTRGGVYNPGGEYLVPAMFYGLWRLDMRLIERREDRDKKRNGRRNVRFSNGVKYCIR